MRTPSVETEMEQYDRYAELPVPQAPEIDDTPSKMQDIDAALNVILTQLKNGAIDPNTRKTIVGSLHEIIKSKPQNSHDTTVHKPTISGGNHTQEPFAQAHENRHGSMYPDAVDPAISAGIQAVSDLDYSKVDLSAGHSLSMELKPKETKKCKKDKKDTKGKGSKQKTCDVVATAQPTPMCHPQEEGVKMDRATQQGAMRELGGGCLVLPCIACCYHWVIQFTSGTIPPMYLQGDRRNAGGATICPECETVPIATRTIMDSNFIEFEAIPMSSSLLYHKDAMEKIEQFVGEEVPVIAFNHELLFVRGREIMKMVKSGGRLVKMDA